jgi:hypothetical protein
MGEEPPASAAWAYAVGLSILTIRGGRHLLRWLVLKEV